MFTGGIDGAPDGRPSGVLAAVGRTPLVELRRVVPDSGARILVKWEPANPTGSMKDRMAVEVIRSAAADGRLPPGGTVVEYTAGTTGISLALVCAALGYRLHVVFSDAFSVEKRKTMLALGAEITDEPSDGGRITAELIKRMIATAEGSARVRGTGGPTSSTTTTPSAATVPSARRSGARPAVGWTRSCTPWERPTRSTASREDSARPRRRSG